MITLPNDELSEEEKKYNAISLSSPLSAPKNQGGNQQSFGPIAPRPPGFVEELGTRAKGRAMEGILNEGQSAIMKGFAAPSAGAANAAALSSTPATMGMAGPSLGAAGASAGIPHVAAALAADELLGFGIRKKVFGMSDGGQVNPSASQYSSGGEVSYAAGGRYEIPHPGPGNSQSDLLKGYDSYLSGFAPASNGMPNMALNFDDWKASVMSANAIRFSDGGQVVPQYYGGGEIQGYAQGDIVDPNELLDEIELEQRTIDSEYIVNDYNSTLEATAGRVLPPLGMRINPAGQPQSILPQHNIYNPNTAPLKGLDEYT